MGGCQSKLRCCKFGLQLRMPKSFLFKRYDDFCDFFRNFSENSNYKIIRSSKIPNPVFVYFQRLRILPSKKAAQFSTCEVFLVFNKSLLKNLRCSFSKFEFPNVVVRYCKSTLMSCKSCVQMRLLNCFQFFRCDVS